MFLLFFTIFEIVYFQNVLMSQITLKDIAKALNLSPSTVSRAMKNHPAISAETRVLVQEYAETHKYKPNTLAM